MQILWEKNLQQTRAFADENSIRNKSGTDESIYRWKFYQKQIWNRREHLQMKILSETNLEQSRAFADENSIRNKSGTVESICKWKFYQKQAQTNRAFADDNSITNKLKQTEHLQMENSVRNKFKQTHHLQMFRFCLFVCLLLFWRKQVKTKTNNHVERIVWKTRDGHGAFLLTCDEGDKR
jgi:hypothetical protein